jgi:hypothetical protein
MAQNLAPMPGSKPAYWSDALLWLLILVSLGLATWWVCLHWTTVPTQVISLAFEDANELRVGSPVRMMGYEVGYIQNLEVLPDHIQVGFKTYPGAPHIPRGSHFTISFSGLVGAKSIEITPPASLAALDPDYHVENPIRLKETLQYQIDIAQALESGAENMADFFGKKKPVEELKYNIKSNDTLIASATRHMLNAKTVIVQEQQEISGGLNDLTDAVDDFTHVATEANSWFAPDQAPKVLHEMLMGAYDVQASLLGVLYEQKITKATDELAVAAEALSHTRQRVTAAQIPERVEAVSWRVLALRQGMVRFSNSMTLAGWVSWLHAFDHGLVWWDVRLRRWQKHI